MNKENKKEIDNLCLVSKDFKAKVFAEFEKIEQLMHTGENKTAEINSIVKVIEKYYDRISDVDIDLQEKLILYNSKKNFQKDFEGSRNEFEKEYFLKFSLVSNYLKENNYKPIEKSVSSSSLNNANLQVKLPELKLKEFSGDQKDWSPFWQAFSCSIHDNDGLSPVIKLTYLKSLLSTRALRLVDSIPTTDEGYSTAVEILKSRFDRVSVSSTEAVNKFFSIVENIKFINKNNMQVIYDDLLCETIKLKHLNVPEQVYSHSVIFKLIPKLPEKIQNKIVKDPSKFSLQDVLNLMANSIDLEHAKLAFKNVSEDKRNMFRNSPAARVPNQNTTLLVDNKVSCRLCNKNHLYFKCSLPLKSKWEIIKKYKLCSKCCGRGHSANECRTTIFCRTCNQPHNSSLCWNNQPNTSSSMVAEATVSVDTPAGLNPTVPEFSPENVLFNKEKNQFHLEKNHVLLQTAYVNVSHPNDSRICKPARILFDSGSQRSYINRDLAAKLNLPIQSSEKMTVNTFGDNKSREMKTNLVEFNISSGSFSKVLQARTAEVICAPLNNEPIPEKYLPEIFNLKLADPMVINQKQLSVDILVGSDFYWQFMNGNTHRTEFGPIAVNTPLGIILSGSSNVSSDKKVHHTHLS